MSPDRLEGKIRNAIRIMEEEVWEDLNVCQFATSGCCDLRHWFWCFWQGAYHEEGLCSHEKDQEWALRSSLDSGFPGFCRSSHPSHLIRSQGPCHGPKFSAFAVTRQFQVWNLLFLTGDATLLKLSRWLRVWKQQSTKFEGETSLSSDKEPKIQVTDLIFDAFLFVMDPLRAPKQSWTNRKAWSSLARPSPATCTSFQCVIQIIKVFCQKGIWNFRAGVCCQLPQWHCWSMLPSRSIIDPSLISFVQTSALRFALGRCRLGLQQFWLVRRNS